MQFSTKPYDEKTGLSYYGYRFYVPALGRWLTRDPLGEDGGINVYGFVGNDPVNTVDPDGLQALPLPVPIPLLPFAIPGTSANNSFTDATKKALRRYSNDDDPCLQALIKCLENPKQPEWNQRPFGPRKDCGACYRECKRDGRWPYYKCPL